MFDVAVIGAGPAGTAAAFDLLSAGARVLILDKTHFPRKKACAGGITPKGMNLFRYDVSPVIRQTCHCVKITKKNGASFDIENRLPLCYMTRREELDSFSLARVIEMGGCFKVAKKIHNIQQSARGVQIQTDIGSFMVSYVIGADGANSRVRRLTGQHKFWLHQVALEADVYVADPDRFKMEFDFSGILNGYQWIFPKDDHVNIGLYGTGHDTAFKTKQLADYARKRTGVSDLKAVKGYPICTGGYRYRPGQDRILLAGDAAGMAERLLGEGIFFALKSGQLAAGAILDSLKDASICAAYQYVRELSGVKKDLQIYDLSAHLLYKIPRLSLSLLSIKALQRPFARGYAQGKTISRILLLG